MTGTFAGYLMHIKAIDGFDGLGRLAKEWENTDVTANSRLTNRCTFTQFLRERFSNEWTAYLSYCRLINKDT